jgi:cytidine deaminase
MKITQALEFEKFNNYREEGIVNPITLGELEGLLKHAYAPYSNYPVSCIIYLDNGEKVVGTNQENAAFPSGLCAERVAVLAAKAAYPQASVREIYIMTNEEVRSPAAPCGACRQVLHEVELRQEKPYELYLLNKTDELFKFKGIQTLLPLSFTLPK